MPVARFSCSHSRWGDRTYIVSDETDNAARRMNFVLDLFDFFFRSGSLRMGAALFARPMAFVRTMALVRR
jgi:hypothetical protein